MLKRERAKPGRCPHCSNFMNWSHEWDNLWGCGGCGELMKVGPSISTRTVVEEAVRAAKEPNGRW